MNNREWFLSGRLIDMPVNTERMIEGHHVERFADGYRVDHAGIFSHETALARVLEGCEAGADMAGRKISRDERKALRTADLRRLDYAALTALRAKTAKTIEHNHATYERQLENGMPVTLEQAGKNNASHWLTVQCIDEILDEAACSYGDK